MATTLPKLTGLVATAGLNTKATEIQIKIPNITEVESKMPDVTNLATKATLKYKTHKD